MKIIYGIFIASMISLAGNAQFVADFETFQLTPNSYDNGSSGGGDFILDGWISVNNYYDTAWMSWNGFAVSNMTDDTTAGWGNQYSAFSASGANGSSNFGVAYYNPVITAQAAIIDSFKISNSSYAAISMRDGDAFAKQFGSPNNASGIPDGTNGEDFFKVWMICTDNLNGTKDSIDFYLADYRFPNNNDDYIIDEWVNIDLTGLSVNVGSISFRFESSDVGQFGMNTPAYFVVDDIAYNPLESVDELTTAELAVYPNPFEGQLMVQGDEGILSVYSVNGQLIHTEYYWGTTALQTSNWPVGMYIVELSTDNGKVQRKVIK